jgi:hypothetical protein
MSHDKETDFFFNQMLRRDLAWYSSYFEPSTGKPSSPVRGEISPNYARLKSWHVRKIAQLIPNLRIVFTIRNPVDRVWSQTLSDYGFLRNRDVGELNAMAFLMQVQRVRTELASDYGRTIENWSRSFGRDAVHVDLFDRFVSEPQGFVNGILEHIGASKDWTIPRRFLDEKVWSKDSLIKGRREMPEIVRWYVAEQWLEPMERLNDQLDGRISHWVAELRELSSGRHMSWRLIREVNRHLLSLPERLAFSSYDIKRDVHLWLRWRKLLQQGSD